VKQAKVRYIFGPAGVIKPQHKHKHNMQNTIFCYGTLQQPHTQRELIGRTLNGPICTLKGFKIVRNVYDPTDGNFYPSLVFDTESVVYGHAYKVTAEELAILDEYETELYIRVESQVITAETGEQVPVQIYMAAPTPAAAQ